MKTHRKVQIVNKNGVSAIQINGKIYPPVSFKSFRPVERNLTDFYNAGVRLFNILTTGTKSAIGIPYSFYGESWLDDEKYDFAAIDKQIEFFMEHAPEAYFCLMICLDTREWWLNKYAGYPNSYTHLSQMESDPYWREMAAKYMQAVIRHTEEKYGERMYGYFLLNGATTEWISLHSKEVPSEFVNNAYRQWKHDNSAELPSMEKLEKPGDMIFLDLEEDRDVIDYRMYSNRQRAETILWFTSKAQEVIQHEKLLGIYYGYIMELGGRQLYDFGHIGYEPVFKSEDIDIIASPFAYDFRAQDSGSQQMLTNTTVSLHNKLYFLEHDQTTCLVPDYIEGAYFTHPNKAKNIKEDVNLLRRDFMFSIANNCAIWWFDMFSGWFYDDTLMEEIRNMISIYERLIDVNCKPVSEVAFVIDPESFYYANKMSGLNNMLLYYQRAGLSFMGAPYDMYSVCDIEKLDMEQYKLIIFASQFQQNEAVDKFVKRACDCGKTLLFMYAHNVIKNGVFSVATMSESLGMQICENPAREQCMLLDDGYVMDSGNLKRCYAISDEGTNVIGHYQQSGQPAIGWKQIGNGKIIFSGLGNLDARILKEVLALADVHQYLNDENAIVYANSSVLGLYHRTEEPVKVTLVRDAEYVDVLNRNKKYQSKDKCLIVPYDDERAKLLILMKGI